MTHDIQRRLRNLRTTEKLIVPDAAWVRATRDKLHAQVKESLPTGTTLSFWNRVRGTVKAFLPQGTGAWMRRPAVAAFSVVAIVAGGSIMSVSAAEQSLPGDFLYNLKLATEQARLAFTPVQEDRLVLKTEFTNRRVNELRQVADDNEHPERVAQVAEILKSDMNTLQQQLNDVAQSASPASAAAAAKLVDQKTTQVITDLQATKSQLAPGSQEAVTEAQSAAANTSVAAIEVLAAQNQQSNAAVPAADVTQAIIDHAKVVVAATSNALPLLIATSTDAVASTTQQVLVNIGSSSTLSVTSSSITALIGQIKDATTQAFADQQAKDQTDADMATSSTAAVPTGASSSTDALVTTSTSATTSSTQAITASSTPDANAPPPTTSSTTDPPMTK